MGPQRGLGADYVPCVRNGVSCEEPARFPQAVVLSHLYDCGLSYGVDDLFRSELHPGRHAQLCKRVIETMVLPIYNDWRSLLYLYRVIAALGAMPYLCNIRFKE